MEEITTSDCRPLIANGQVVVTRREQTGNAMSEGLAPD